MIEGKLGMFACGPLEIEVIADSDVLAGKVADTLELYNVAWPATSARRSVDIRADADAATLGSGEYLECARMNVDSSTNNNETGLRATCPSGIAATSSHDGQRWNITVPDLDSDPWILTDMESVLSLVLTEGWRATGWTPVHAATVICGDTCAIVCAASGGGKTTLTTALIRRGWQTLGDDKLLLRIDEHGEPELRALVHTFNLHPQTRAWFPEVGDLEELPAYSEWTEKRKLRPELIWPGTTVSRATPNCLLQIVRTPLSSGVTILPMSAGDVLSTLLRQTVIPSRSAEARAALSTIAATARRLSGLNVHLGDDVYLNPDCLEPLEAALKDSR